MTEAILVMLNNYFHDLAVAFLFASTLLAHVVLRHWPGPPSARVAAILRRVAWGSLIWIGIGGAVRTWYFREYEWLPMAGRGIVPALAVKHVFMTVLTVWGLAGVVLLNRKVRRFRSAGGDRLVASDAGNPSRSEKH